MVAGVQHLRGRSDGEFSLLHSGEQIVQQVRHKEQVLGSIQDGNIIFLERIQLEQTVKLKELDTGESVHFFAGNQLKVFGHNGIGVRVAVRKRDPDHPAVFAQKAKVHPPGVDTHRFRFQPRLGAGGQRLLETFKDLKYIPVEIIEHLHHAVGETGHFLRGDFAIFKSSCNGTIAGGSQVERDKGVLAHKVKF